MPEAGFNWTDDRVLTLRRMWVAGASSGLISRALGGGVTRNAVMGKVNRLGLMGAGGRAERSTAPVTAPRIEAAMPPLPHAALSEPAKVAPKAAVAKAPAGKAPVARVSVPEAAPAAPAPMPKAEKPRLSVRDLVAAALSGSHPATRPRTDCPAPPVAAIAVESPAPKPAKPAAVAAAKPAGARVARTPPAKAVDAAPVPEAAHEAVDALPPPPVMSQFSWEAPRADGRPTLLGLKAESCRWPIGDPGKEGFHFCGETASEPRPYCSEHCAVAYQVRDPNRPKVVWSPMRIAQARQATLARLRQGPQRGRARARA